MQLVGYKRALCGYELSAFQAHRLPKVCFNPCQFKRPLPAHRGITERRPHRPKAVIDLGRSTDVPVDRVAAQAVFYSVLR
jgi:hypothetical protein